MLSYKELRNANLDESRRMLQELGIKFPMPGERPVFNKPKIASKRAKQSKQSEAPPEPDLDEKKSDENGQPTVRSSFRVRLRTKQHYHEDSLVWEAPEAKVPRVRPDNSYGSIEGVEVGREWATRMECSSDLVHRPTVAGIHGGPEGAYSVALSGGYEDDIDLGDSFTYTGEGGRDLKGTPSQPKNLRTAAQSKDQTLDKGNLALAVSVDTQKPVRVIRGFKLRSPYAPEEGYRYDGLYFVKKFWVARGKSGFKVFKYAFVRCDPEPAPWTKIQTEISPWIKSPASPSTPAAVLNKDLEACEAPSLKASESEDLEKASEGAAEPERSSAKKRGRAHLEEAAEPERSSVKKRVRAHREETSEGTAETERSSVKKRVSFYTKDSVRLFESEDPEEASSEDEEEPYKVRTRRSTRSEALVAENTRDSQQSSEKSTLEISEKSDSSPKPGGRTRALRNSSRSVVSSKNDTSPENGVSKHSDEGADEPPANSSKMSKASKNHSVPSKSLGLRSKVKPSDSSPENTSEELPDDARKTKHDSKADVDNAPVFIRKSERSPKPTEKIKSPGDFRWLKKFSKRSEEQECLADTQNSNNSIKVSEQKRPIGKSTKASPKTSAEIKSPKETLRTKASSKISTESQPEGRSSDDSPKSKNSPITTTEKGPPDDTSKSKKSPKSTAEKRSPKDTPKSKKSPIIKAERGTPDDTSKSKKSPKVNAEKRSPKETPKSKKSPGLSPKSKKSPKIISERKGKDLSNKHKSSEHKKAQKSSVTDKTESPVNRTNPKKSKMVKSVKETKKHSKSPNKVPVKSPKKAATKVSVVAKVAKSASVKTAASILSKAKAPKLPTSTFQKKIAMIASARAKALKMKEESIKNGKVTTKSDSGIVAVSSPKSKLKTKSSAKTVQPARGKATKRPAPSPSVTSPTSVTSLKKKPRLESPKTSTKVKKSPPKKARISQELESMKDQLVQADNGGDDPPTLQRFDEEPTPMQTSDSPKRKNPTPDNPVMKKSSTPDSPEKRQNDTPDSPEKTQNDTPDGPEKRQNGKPDNPEKRLNDTPDGPGKWTNWIPDSPARERVREEIPGGDTPSSSERRLSNSSVRSSPPWSPVGSPSPVGKSPSQTRTSPSSPKKQATVPPLSDDSFDDDELLGMMQFSLCPCSAEGNTKVTVKMVDGKWTEIIETKTDEQVTDLTLSAKADVGPTDRSVNSLTDSKDEPMSTR